MAILLTANWCFKIIANIIMPTCFPKAITNKEKALSIVAKYCWEWYWLRYDFILYDEFLTEYPNTRSKLIPYYTIIINSIIILRITGALVMKNLHILKLH